MQVGPPLPGISARSSSESGSGSETDSVVGSSQFDTSTGNDTIHNNASSSSGETLVHNETKAVKRSKLLVHLALLCAAAAVGTVTYIFACRQESAQFRSAVRYLVSETNT